jgi:hypothetical protein
MGGEDVEGPRVLVKSVDERNKEEDNGVGVER